MPKSSPTGAAGSTTTAIGGAEQAVATMRIALVQLRELVATLGDVTNSIVPELRQISDYLRELSVDFQGSGEGGFYLPQRSFDDPRFQEIIPVAVLPRWPCDSTAGLR